MEASSPVVPGLPRTPRLAKVRGLQARGVGNGLRKCISEGSGHVELEMA